jgi:hypothetical protein
MLRFALPSKSLEGLFCLSYIHDTAGPVSFRFVCYCWTVVRFRNTLVYMRSIDPMQMFSLFFSVHVYRPHAIHSNK